MFVSIALSLKPEKYIRRTTKIMTNVSKNIRGTWPIVLISADDLAVSLETLLKIAV